MSKVFKSMSQSVPQLMAIMNLTPDSFSDGGQWWPRLPEEIVAQARQLVVDGADILDIGGESTRPGATEVPEDEELQRVLPAIQAIHAALPNVPLSIDTRKAAVAKAAVAVGARMINDVSGLRFDADMVHVAAETGAQLVIMHSIGTPENMQQLAETHAQIDIENNVAIEAIIEIVYRFLAQQAEHAMTHGVRPENIVMDPGFGFGKTSEQNLALLRGLSRFKALGFPVLVGLSRKSFLACLATGGLATTAQPQVIPPDQREALTAVAHTLAYQAGAQLFRVHDVKTQKAVLTVLSAI